MSADLDQTVDLAIVGGGIAGLAAAFEACKRGASCVVLEAAARPGGVILTESHDGFTIDAGPDALLAQKPAAIQLCQELGLGDRLMPTTPPRTAFVMRGGRLHPLPDASVLGIPTRLAPFATSSLFSPMGKLRMGLDLVIPASRSTADESIASFIGRRFGHEAVRYLAEPLLAGIHAGDVDRLSMDALFPSLRAAERRHGSLIRAFRAARRGAGGDGPFRSLPGGLGELVDALAGALPSDILRCGARVKAIEPGTPFVVRVECARPVRTRQIIFATPAHVTARLIAPVDRDLTRLCEEIPYQSTVTVFLAYPRAAVTHPLLGNGFVVPRAEPGAGLMAATWVSSKWTDRVPRGQVLLRGFMGGARDPDVVDWEDDHLIDVCRDQLSRILGISGAPRLVKLYRWVRATAQHEVGHLGRLAAIGDRLRRSPGLYLTGSGYRGTGIPDCVADGRRVAAEAIAAASRRAQPGDG